MKKKIPVKKSRKVIKSTKKYTTIKSRHLDDKYHDPDVILYYTMFEILTQYMEKESNNIDWNFDKRHQDAFRELCHLTFWFNHVFDPWKSGKHSNAPDFKGPFLIEVKNGVPGNKPHYEINRKGNEAYWEYLEEDQDMTDNMNERLIKNMKRLCELSPYLWS